MKLPRLSITQMMTVMGIAAFDMAATRALPDDDDHELLTGVALMALSLQVGIMSLIRSQGRTVPFSAGFSTFGSIAMGSYLYVVFFCPSDSVTIDPITGRADVTPTDGSAIWILYALLRRVRFQ